MAARTISSRAGRAWVQGSGWAAKLCLCGAIALFSAESAQAQKDGPKKIVHDDIVLTTKDDWAIHLSYYQSDGGKETPVVMLLHVYGGNRLVWEGDGGFADRLHQEGYSVITVDLRRHGQSKATGKAAKLLGKGRGGDATGLKPADYQAMVENDLVAVKEFIAEQHAKQLLNMNKLAIVAPEMSAPIALHFSEWDWSQEPYNDAPTEEGRTPRGQDVRAIVLLSPESHLPRLSTGKPLKTLRNPEWNIAFLVLYSETDPYDRGQAKRMFHQLAGRSKSDDTRMYLKDYAPRKARGTDILGKDTMVEEYIMTFLSKYLRDAPGKWQDRRSRYNRD